MTQSLVADAVSRALDHFYHYREENKGLEYYLSLQIHDAVLLEVPIPHIERVWNEVIPECMVNRVPLYPANMDGHWLGTGPYHFGIGKDMYINWGEAVTPEQAKQLGIPAYLLED